IVELKTGVTISLILQGIDRLSVTDYVYIAVPKGKPRAWRKTLRDTLKLCRRVGLGFISVSGQTAHIHLDPVPYTPRKIKKRQARLLGEFAARQGDPNQGGATRTTIVTAYRQEAMRVAEHLLEHGACKPAIVAKAVDAPKARIIMYDNHYGWFERIERGLYDLTVERRATLVSRQAKK
ncbi:MAG: DUF2161 family putative PD-(D/E)XK-type phosphodiesterase, partial [Gammaproteobacteria bacterium]